MTAGSRTGRLAGAAAAIVFSAVVAACAPPRFEQYIEAQRWSDAAQVFAADSTLLQNDRALYEAGNLFGTPGLSTFDAARARDLYRRLLATFPGSRYRHDASVRLTLVSALLRTREDAAAQQHALEARIAQLTASAQRLRAALDSSSAQADSSLRATSRLEADLHERDEQLRALRLELNQLKAIDLKPRSGRPPI